MREVKKMPRAGLEPARESPDDFKSSASTIPPPRQEALRVVELNPNFKSIVARKCHPGPRAGVQTGFPVKPGMTKSEPEMVASVYDIIAALEQGTGGITLQTSGSMGVPKPIFHTWQQHILAAHAVIQNTGLNAQSCSLLSLPLHHVGGLAVLIRAWVSGGRWLMPPKGWNPQWALEQGVTHLSLVSTQLYRWLQDPEAVKALRSMQAILLGGSAIPANLIKQAYANHLPVIMTYGSTETASQVTATRPGDSLDRLMTSGRCLAGREIKLSAEGEICVQGAMICESGFYQTGDLGVIDSQGYLTVLGRRDNRMISGGENIYPEEIERILQDYPMIERVLVVPKQDAEFGQRPCAFVKTQGIWDPESWRSYLREHLPGFKVPKFWREWPRDWPEDQKPNRIIFSKLTCE